MTERIHLILGEDEYLVAEAVHQTLDKLVPPDRRSFGLEMIDGAAGSKAEALAAIGQCLDALLTTGFLGEGKVVWFKDVNFLSENETGRLEAVKTKVDELAKLIKTGLPPGQTLVLSAPKMDKRRQLFKICQDVGRVQEFAIPEKAAQAEAQARKRLGERIRPLKLTMSDEVANAFIERVGTDTRHMVNELQKLALYLGDRQTVTRQDLSSVVCSSRSAMAWDLTDAIGKRDLGKALILLRQLLFQKETAIGLIFLIESWVRQLAILREALDRGWLREKNGGWKATADWTAVPPEGDVLLSALDKDPRSMNPYRVLRLIEQARRFKPADLRRCEDAVVDAHVRLVTTTLPPRLVMELLMAKMLA